jgi:hypothetical protein
MKIVITFLLGFIALICILLCILLHQRASRQRRRVLFKAFAPVIWLLALLFREPFSPLPRLFRWFGARLRPPGSIALANAVGLMFSEGHETLQVDPTVSFPVSSKYLGYMRGSTQYYAKLWDGGATAASFPLGVSPDAPYQSGDFLTINRLDATVGTQIGMSAGAITIDHLVYAAANGLFGDLQSATAGGGGGTTYWVIGRATASVTAASQEISFVPCDPYLLTATNGTLTNPNNPL